MVLIKNIFAKMGLTKKIISYFSTCPYLCLYYKLLNTSYVCLFNLFLSLLTPIACPSVTCWADYLFIIWQFTALKIYPIADFAKIGSKFAKH